MKGFFASSITAAQPSCKHRPRFFSAAGLIAVATLVLFLTACAGPAQSTAPNTAANQAATMAVTTVTEQDELAAQSSGTGNAQSYLIKVYFSRFNTSDEFAVFPVSRLSPTLAVATFSIQSLIAGPTLSERAAGYYTELNSTLSGPSSCNGAHPVGGPDFKLSLNKKGGTTEQGTATVQFCRTYTSGGIGTDSRVTAEITATLKQFSNIKKVVILSQTGHCIGDESGQDLCLK
jgi:hypothetical protein